MIDPNRSKNMHLHTERSSTFFPKNSINEIAQRYSIALSLSKNKTVLEVGPGTGYASKEIIEASKKYLAIEYSRENVKEFKLNYPNTKVLNIDFIHNEIEKNYHDQKFDTIISLANIYYFDFTKFLTKSADLLTVNGKLFFCTPNIMHADFNAAPFTIKYYSYDEINILTKKFGFDIEIYGIPNNNKSKSISLSYYYLKLILKKFFNTRIYDYLKTSFGISVQLPEKLIIPKFDIKKLKKIENNFESKDFFIMYCIGKKL